MLFLNRIWTKVLLLSAASLASSYVYAKCWPENTDRGNAEYFLVNGRINKPTPEIVFDIPGSNIGGGGRIASTLVNNSGNASRPNEVRFRLSTKKLAQTNNGNGGGENRSINLYVDSTSPLTCTNCAGTVTIPLSKIGWQTSSTNGSSAPADGQFNNGQQFWLNAQEGEDHIFFLEFDFLNDTVYPAGTYTGAFHTQGEP